MKFGCFSEIDACVVGVKFHKIFKEDNYGGKDIGIINIYFENGDTVILSARGDCCSCSYFVEFSKFPFSNLIGKKIKSMKEIRDNDDMVKRNFRGFEPIYFRGDDYNTYHLYEMELSNDEIFNFGLNNSSNGYYDGWIDIDYFANEL